MAIRIRQINGKTIAVCAAITTSKKGDIYLDDNIHHALSTKFGLDFNSENLFPIPIEKDLEDLMKIEQGGKTI